MNAILHPVRLPQASPGHRPGRPADRRRPGQARLLRGRPDDPAWARPALLALLLATALLYLAGLSRNGWANEFYAAAVQAGTKSWKAFLFGSLDSTNFITVDKTPAFLWVMELSARIFGFSSWSLLLPQALEGVATVGVLYATVRRWFGPGGGDHRRGGDGPHPGRHADVPLQQPRRVAGAGHDAGRVRHHPGHRVGPDPVAGPDRGAARAGLPDQDAAGVPGPARVRAGLPVGGPPRLGKRIWQLLAGGAALLAAAGWWVAIVLLTPAAGRPYVGGSTDNNILQLTFGYNGLGRLTGSGNSAGAGAGRCAPARRSRGPAGRRRGPGRRSAVRRRRRRPRSAGRPASPACSRPRWAGRSAG